MKINYVWDTEYALDKIGVQLHPKNETIAAKITKLFTQENKLAVIDPINERKSKIDFSAIYMIESMDHLSKVYTTDGNVCYTKGRLKEFEYLRTAGIVRINNSVLLNLSEVVSFQNGQYARLEVHTKNGQTLTVSRHYAKQIKEEL